SSLCQNTVGMPRRRQTLSSSVTSELGPDGPVSLNFHAPSLPFHADSMKTKSRSSSSFDHPVNDRGRSDHSNPKLWAENSSRMAPTRKSENTGVRSGRGRAGNSSASTSAERLDRKSVV